MHNKAWLSNIADGFQTSKLASCILTYCVAHVGKRSPRSPIKTRSSPRKVGASKSPRASPRMRSRSPLASARSVGSVGSMGFMGNGSRSNLDMVALRGVASHAWHDVPYGEIAPEVVNVVVEVPADSKVVYAFDKESGMLGVEKVLASSMLFPHNYGFIPQTLIGDENQPLGVIVLMQKPVQPMTFLQVREPPLAPASGLSSKPTIAPLPQLLVLPATWCPPTLQPMC
jgi:hypothetical protein